MKVKVKKLFIFIAVSQLIILLTACEISDGNNGNEPQAGSDFESRSTRMTIVVLPDEEECELYGTWYIDRVALISDMYTGTTLDGDFEENLFDPAEYIGYELQYSEEFFCLGDAEYCDPLYELQYQSVEEYDNGGKFDFIPVGTQCILLNKDTMLLGIWGKILLAYRKY